MDFTRERAKLHCHTEQSLRDSAEKISVLVQCAKEMGVPALALTNHGIMVDMPEFVKYCEENGIKPIPGVEGYYSDDNDTVTDTHICLYPQDYEAYSYIGMALTEAGNRLHNDKPVLDTAMLTKYFGKGSPVHGKVMMTSACVSGVFAKHMTGNEKVKKQTDVIEKKISKLKKEFDNKRYLELDEEISFIKERKEKLAGHKEELSKIIQKKYTKEKKKVEKLIKQHSTDYETALSEYNLLIETQDRAKREFVEIKDEIEKLDERKKAINNEHKKLKNKKEKIDCYENDIDIIKQNILSASDMYAEMKKKAEIMIEIFGKDNVYCEIQYHRLNSEKEIFPYVVKLADELDLKLCTANDAHYAYNTRDSVRARQLMLSLRFDRYVKEEADHKEYYLKSDKELYDILSELYDTETIEKAFNGVDEIASRCNFKYSEEKHYPKYHGNAEYDLREMAYTGIRLRYPDDWDKEKEERLEYELKVINKLGVADYLCIVADYIKAGKQLGQKHETKLGYGVGPGRGSAAGSIVCYLTEITNIDPIKYGLLFERFLNEDRVTMPDIDVDFSEECREKVIQYCENKYGKKSMCAIITESTMAAKASIRNAAKFLGLEQGDAQMYYDTGDILAKKVPFEQGITLKKCEDRGLFTDLTDIQAEIIHTAKLVEGTISGYSSHAAGIVIGDGGDISRYVPLKHIPAKKDKPDTWVCQCDMIQVEELGCLKMDFLGLKTLDVITKTIRMVYKNKGIVVNLDNIPFEPEVFSYIYSKGNTRSVFQVEGPGMRSMFKKLKPDCIEDVIMAISIYRPGPIQYMDSLIARKAGKEKITYSCKELEPILKNTYGCIIYQEQVMQIFQSLAGYSLSDADTIRRYMSKKKTEKLEKERAVFIYGDEKRNIKGCVSNGISESVATELFDEMTDFAKYAFNKSHAAAYAIVSYQTAYLKYHYPVEFYAANLSVVGKEKIPALIKEIRDKKYTISIPNINESESDFTTDGERIIFGLNGINGMGNKSREILEKKGFMYNSYIDFLIRGHRDITSTEALIHAGAFDTFTPNRKALEQATGELLDVIDKLNKIKKKLQMAEAEYMENPQDAKKEVMYREYKRNVEVIEHYLSCYKFDTNIYEDELEKLNKEYDALGGVYLSGHPLDSYNKPLNCVYIESIYNEGYEGFIHLYGSVKNLEIKHRKSDGKEMAFFELEDVTGTINVACFSNEYVKLREMLKENAVLKVAGKVVIEYRDEPTEDIENTYVTAEYQLILRECEVLHPVLPVLILNVPNIIYYIDNIMSSVPEYHSTDGRGRNLLIHDRMTGEFREYKYPVMSEICRISETIKDITFMDM